MTALTLTPEQQRVYDAIEHADEHIFVTGRAGTGKSTLLGVLAETTEKNLVICAPTGVAALNVGGQTIHSLFKLPIGVIANHEIEQNRETKRLLSKIDTLVIDEISMVNADLMDAIDRSLRQARGKPLTAFGGVQVVLFGDPYQLSPVPPRDPDERAYFDDHYDSMWFFDAKVWREASITLYELTEIHRQHESDFKAILNAVRHGVVTAPMAARLNEAGSRPAPTTDVITLATRNDAVQRINERNLAELSGKALTARAEISGEFGGANGYPADEKLELKPGAQVMFLRNDADGRWVNGSLGRVTKIKGNVFVEVDGEEHEVEPVVWEKYKYNYVSATKELTRDVAGEFTQFPLRLAWGVTIHKSQGKTYDRAIVDLGSRVFAPGQTYVALSRVRSLDGLYLTRPLKPSDIIIDLDVKRFMQRLREAAS